MSSNDVSAATLNFKNSYPRPSMKIYIYLLTLILLIPSPGNSESTDSLLQVLDISKLPSDKIVVLNKLAAVFAENDTLRSENYAKRALFLAKSINDLQGKSEACFYLGWIAQQKKQHGKAMDYLLEAEEGFNILKDENWLADTYLLLGREYQYLMEHEKAINYLFMAMNIYKKTNDQKKLAQTYFLIAGNYFDRKNYEKAYEFYSNSLELYTVLDELVKVGSLYNNLGEIYRINNDFTKAMEYYKKSLDLIMRFDDPVRMAAIYNNIGNTYLEENKLDSAEYYLQLGLELAKISDDEKRMSSTLISYGKLSQARGDLDASFKYIKEGYDLAVKGKDFSNIIIASKILSELYVENKDYKNAYLSFLHYRQKDDSLQNIDNREKITQLEMNLIFNFEKEINKIHVQQTNLRYLTIAFILISFIVLIVLLYGRQRIKISEANAMAKNLQLDKNQLLDEIEHKNRELATNVMYLVKKNETINFISEKLLTVKKDFEPPVRKSIESILIELQSNMDENIWKVFEDRFKEVHNDFYSKLMEQFPKLSENEKKLCAFIRLNMSTKEIASITHQNPNSIEVARTRLRKKLNISNEDISLNSYLSNI